MITPAPIKRGTGAYYSRFAAIGGGGRWLGPGLERVGHIPGEVVTPEAFQAALDGEVGVQITRVANRRPGWDFTVAAPKSVSLLAVAHPDPAVRDAIVEAHRASVEKAVAALAERAAVVRMGHAGKDGFRPAEIIAAAFDHAGARPVRSEATTSPQPHLHTHVVIPNLGFRPEEEDRARAIVGRVLIEHAPLAGSVYRVEFARRLHDLGFTINHHDFTFDVAGFDHEVLARFSARSEQIRAAMAADEAEAGAEPQAQSPAAIRHAQIRAQRHSRAAKIDTEMDVLGDQVRAQMAEMGYDASFWETLREQSPSPNTNPTLARMSLLAGAILEHVRAGTEPPAAMAERLSIATLDHAMRGRSWCREADIWVAIGSILPDDATTEELEALVSLVARHDESLPLAWLGHEAPAEASALFSAGRGDGVAHITRRFTSRGVLAQESDTAALALAMQGGPSANVLTKLRRSVERDQSLTKEQRDAASLVLQDRHVAAILGVAGSGKTLLVASLAMAARKERVPIFGVAATGLAAGGLRAAAGIQTSTVDRLLMQRTIKKGSVLVVDEAAMLDAGRLGGLLGLAASNDCKVILIGDDRQLAPVEGASLFSVLTGSLRTAVLRTNYRQKDEADRKAVARLRAGYVREAVGSYVDRGRVTYAESDAAMLAQAVQLFAERAQWRMNIVPWILCRTRADAWTVNEALHLSLFTNRGEPDCWHGAATESWPHKDGDPMIVPERGYAIGERIMCLQNTWIPREAVEGYVDEHDLVRGKLFLPNGYVGTVIGAEDGALRIRGEDGLRITLDADYARSYTDYAWAVTIHKMQGRTVECAILYRANALDYGLAFTSLTRATDETLLLMRYEEEERDRLRYEANVAAIREEAEPDDESVEDRIARLPSPQEIAMRRSTEAWIGLLNRPDEPASALAALADERRIVEMAQGLSADDCLQLAGLWRHWADGGKPPVLDTEERTRLKEVVANPESDEEDRRSATSRLALDRASESLSAVLEWAQNLGHHPDRRFAERMAQLAEAAAVAAVSEERTLRGVEAHEAGEALVSSLGPSAHDVSPWGEGATRPRLRVRGGPRDAAAVTAAVLVSAAHETGADVL
ncbi:MAG: relaxase domain-containing protein, partial [Actinobacteria bacterium]|nr:relaxase domain-containing protein [Actinomycetota bacterium]